ncbi:Crt-like protein 1 [Trichoplax sp. H2]|uniref:EamA domain-containing protein n=1 Tax=Trichoplax adhaerens TaxID=10228 RepID=B3S0V9_TRIAD|nr:hypothetical protein TRIADDRAFT_57187 [Trichoplax adhaerens]EDV24073.1 hypothetical protein TRIADDRAFT_57187 [Trichoplax adhaerens]RDD44346.1 Crt-like protein 1 [Trichoplax sp. H2]|eukprot:XP_002113599.1 hypothetical protein TRIADDRAFT_57187 [Trichoplax adhaerens]
MVLINSRKKQLALGPVRCNLLLANIFFAALSVIGQSGQLISLPLWVDATEQVAKNNASYDIDNITENGNHTHLSMDSYFVVSFASFCYVIFFGAITLAIKFIKPGEIGEAERNFPRKNLIVVGGFDAANGLLVVFASSGTRTPPYLQAILQNVSIPLIVIVRYLLLHKKPTLKKLICTVVVMLCLFICLIPKIFPSINGKAQHHLPHAATGAAAIIWPIIFMIGFIPAAFMNAYEEAGLKMKSPNEKRVNAIWYLTWTSFYQLVTVALFFWLDFLPFYGNQPDIQTFGRSYAFGLSCFFGGSGCSAAPGLRGTSFILFYIINYIGGSLLMRYAEGATLLAIVGALVTPIGFIFWTLFQEEPFMFHPHVSNTTWFSLAGIIVMFPALIIYNMGKKEIDMTNRDDTDSTASLMGYDKL